MARPKLTVLKPKDGDKDHVAVMLSGLSLARTQDNVQSVAYFVVTENDCFIDFCGKDLDAYAGAAMLLAEVDSYFNE